MAQARKFLFDTAFASPAERPQKPKPRFSEEDLAAARGEGQQAGFQMGRESALREVERRLADALERVAEGLGRIDAAQARAAGEIRMEAARLAFAVAAKLAPALVAREPFAEIEGLIAECLAQLPAEPRAVVRVAEPLVDALGARVEELKRRSGFSGALVLLGEPEMAPGDARVEWADGGAERDLGRTLAMAEQAVERYCRMEADTLRRPLKAEPAPSPVVKAAAPEAPSAILEDEEDPLAQGLPALAR